ncbi:MAG: hypothetical protein AVDCRST_MAG72-1458, partial [uncultured Nocardioidaceae bacterium]
GRPRIGPARRPGHRQPVPAVGPCRRGDRDRCAARLRRGAGAL